MATSQRCVQGILTMSDEKVVALLTRALEMIPESLKNEAPTAVTTATSVLNSYIVYKNEISSLSTLYDLASSSRSVSREIAVELLTSCKNITSIKDQASEIISAATIPQPGSLSVQKCVQAALRETANEVLVTSLGISLFGLLFEAVRLYDIWKKICEAKQFVKTGFDVKRARIQGNFDRIPGKINEFAEGIALSFYENLTAQQKLNFQVKKTRECNALRALLSQIEDDFVSLEYEVNGRVQNLRSYCNAANTAALGQCIQGTSLGFSLGMFAPAANPILAVGMGLTMMAHFTAAGTHLVLSKNAKETVKSLGEKLMEIYQFRCILDDQRKSLDLLFEEFCEKIAEENMVDL